MYCNRCGKPVDDDDRFCRNCGNELKRAIDEASRERNNTSMTFTSPSDREDSEQGSSEAEHSKSHRISTDEFVWNIHTFDRPAPKKEEVYVDWSKGQVIEVDLTEEDRLAKEQVSLENAAYEEKGSTLADTENRIRRDDLQSTPSENTPVAMPSEDIPVTIDDIQRDVEVGNADLKRATARIDKFYTFNQKNEQFQKLLDKEYERVHGSVPPDTAEIYLEFDRLTNLDYREPELAEDIIQEPQPQTVNPSDEQQQLDAIIHTQGDLAADILTEDKKEAFDPVEHIKQATIARQEELAKAGIFENSTLIKKFDTMQLERDLIDDAFADDKNGRKFESAVLNELFGEIKKPDIESISLDSGDSPIKQEPVTAEKSDKAILPESQGMIAATPEALHENADSREKTAVDNGDEGKAASDKEEKGADIVIPPAKEPEKQKGNGGRYFGRALLVIALIVFLAGMAAVGITKLAPDSKAAGFIHEEVQPIIDKAFASVEGLFDGGDKKSKEEKKDGEEIDTSGDTAPVSMTTQEIISSQLGNNANIEVILHDINIGYDKSKDYGKKDINESVILSQKYSDIEEYNKRASEIVGTLIKFDSQWIDYVNTKDKAVFDILKKDSNAYRNCIAFKKAGIVKKEFKELRIGEIRAGSSGYYIWADEKIVTIENGKSSEDNHSWIYYFEPNGAEMRVVDYIRDK